MRREVTDATTGLSMMKPRWSPEINFGHMVQAITLAIMVGGGAITSYVAVKADIAAQNQRFSKDTYELSARLHVLEDRRGEDKEFQRETRSKLDELLKMFGEMRLQLVQKQDRNR